jgi:hypothetical protein
VRRRLHELHQHVVGGERERLLGDSPRYRHDAVIVRAADVVTAGNAPEGDKPNARVLRIVRAGSSRACGVCGGRSASRRECRLRLGGRGPRLGARVLREWQRQLHRQQARRVDTQIHRVERQKAAHHEARAGEQHERQRKLGDEERTGPPPRMPPSGSTAPTAFLQYLADARLRHVERRRQPEKNAGPETDGRQEREHLPVHREMNPVRLAETRIGHCGVEETNAEDR